MSALNATRGRIKHLALALTAYLTLLPPGLTPDAWPAEPAWAPPAEEEEEPPQEQPPAPAPTLTVEATAYTARCDGCSGVTYTGVDVRESIYHEGRRVIAVDPSVIALGSTVEVVAGNWTFEAVAADIGGAINGHAIDILVERRADALEFGRRDVKVTIIEEGE